MAGAFASSLMFICGLIGFTILAASVLAYTAYYIVIVVTDTAAGIDEVRWPADSLIDWIGQSLRLFGLVALLLIPVGILLRAIGDSFMPEHPAVRILVLGIPWLWLVFPIGLLSSMSVGAVYAIVRPAILLDLIRVFPSTLFFYVVSAVGISGITALWGVSLLSGQMWLIPLAALASSWWVLVYARLLGRVAWLTVQIKDPPRKRVAGKLTKRLRIQIQVSDPWAAPVAEKSESASKPRKKKPAESLPVEGYDLRDEPLCRPPDFELMPGSPLLDIKESSISSPKEEPPAPLPKIFLDDEDGGEIQIAPDGTPSPEAKPRLEVTPSALDLRLTRSVAAHSPSYPMFSGVWSFPWYVTSLRASVVLSFCWLAAGAWLEALIVLFPF